MRKVLISIITLISIMLLATNVFAATTGNAILTVSKNEIKAGDEITVILRASDSNKLNTVEYSSITITDESGKEVKTIEVKSVEVIGDWSKFDNGGKQAFVYSGSSAVDSAEVCKITLTVKNDIAVGKYNINVNGLTVYSLSLTDDTTTIGKKYVTVEVKAEEPKEENPGGTGNQEPPKEEKPDGSGNQKPSGNKVDNSVSGGNKLPQTGVESAIIIAILVVGIASVVSYRAYRKYTDIK